MEQMDPDSFWVPSWVHSSDFDDVRPLDVGWVATCVSRVRQKCLEHQSRLPVQFILIKKGRPLLSMSRVR